MKARENGEKFMHPWLKVEVRAQRLPVWVLYCLGKRAVPWNIPAPHEMSTEGFDIEAIRFSWSLGGPDEREMILIAPRVENPASILCHAPRRIGCVKPAFSGDAYSFDALEIMWDLGRDRDITKCARIRRLNSAARKRAQA